MKELFKKIKDKFKKRKHHLGYSASAVVFLALGAALAQNDIIKIEPQQPKEVILEETEFFQEDFVDPREIENTLRDLARMKSEARGFVKRAKKLPEIKQRAEEIIKEIDGYIASIKNPPADYTQREVLQEFYDARMWEEVQKIRTQLELPQMLKDLPAAIKKVERLIKLKSYQKIGLDLTSINNYLAEAKETVKEAQSLHQEGDWEGAMEVLQFMNESGHPGELEGVIRRLKEANDRIKTIKDKDVKAQLLESLVPVIEAVNEGDFRFANEVLNEIFPEIYDIIKRSYKLNSKTKPEILKRVMGVEEKVQNKIEGAEEEQIRKEEEMKKIEAEKIRQEEEMKKEAIKKEEMRKQEEMKKQEQINKETVPNTVNQLAPTVEQPPTEFQTEPAL